MDWKYFSLSSGKFCRSLTRSGGCPSFTKSIILLESWHSAHFHPSVCMPWLIMSVPISPFFISSSILLLVSVWHACSTTPINGTRHDVSRIRRNLGLNRSARLVRHPGGLRNTLAPLGFRACPAHLPLPSQYFQPTSSQHPWPPTAKRHWICIRTRHPASASPLQQSPCRG